MEIKPRLFYRVVKNLGRPRPLKAHFMFRNWDKSGLLYIKDNFIENGLLKSSEQILDILCKKFHWICEYKIIQQDFFLKYEHLIDYSKIPYIILQSLSMGKQYSKKIFYSELVKAEYNKIKNVKDLLLAEFNDKLLNCL